eukprot:6205617-Pleurochrysis_carterae.AAC.6
MCVHEQRYLCSLAAPFEQRQSSAASICRCDRQTARRLRTSQKIPINIAEGPNIFFLQEINAFEQLESCAKQSAVTGPSILQPCMKTIMWAWAIKLASMPADVPGSPSHPARCAGMVVAGTPKGSAEFITAALAEARAQSQP